MIADTSQTSFNKITLLKDLSFYLSFKTQTVKQVKKNITTCKLQKPRKVQKK